MKIVCVARNYGKHARELNNPLPAEPVFFLKPESSLLTNGRDFEYPDFSELIQHEIELVLRLGRDGRNIPRDAAHDYIQALGLGIDFTARDLQKDCMEKGLPWEKAKAFQSSAVLGDFLEQPASDENIAFRLTINGADVQTGESTDMIFGFHEIIAYVSRFMKLEQGDLIYTGTPSGVGPVQKGDELRGFIHAREMLKCRVV